MEQLKNITLTYNSGELVFIFSNQQHLSLYCSITAFEQINNHLQTYKNADDSESAKDRFFNH